MNLHPLKLHCAEASDGGHRDNDDKDKDFQAVILRKKLHEVALKTILLLPQPCAFVAKLI